MPNSGYTVRIRDDGIYWGDASSLGIDAIGAWRMRLGGNGPLVERCTTANWTTFDKWTEFNNATGAIEWGHGDKPAWKVLVSTDSPYTVTTSDFAIEANAAGGAITINLPAVASLGSGYQLSIGKSDSSNNMITIDGNGAETIDGAANYFLPYQWEGITLACNGSTGWRVLAKHSGSGGGQTGSFHIATVASGTTSVTVTHSFGSTPHASDLHVIATNNLGNAAKFWVTNINSTTFDIAVNVDPGVGTATFAWRILA